MPPRIQGKVALDKEAHPERYCPARGCLWRTDDRDKYPDGRCPRHPAIKKGAP